MEGGVSATAYVRGTDVRGACVNHTMVRNYHALLHSCQKWNPQEPQLRGPRARHVPRSHSCNSLPGGLIPRSSLPRS